MRMKCPLVVKSPGSMLATSSFPSSSAAFMPDLSVSIAVPLRPKAAAPSVKSVQAVPAPGT